MSKTRNRILAEKIAKHLFMSGSGERAFQLRLCSSTSEYATNYGGWCETAVADYIEDALAHNARTKK